MAKKAETGTYYELLGVGRDADVETVKRAFRHLAKTHHPDKGGDPEKFKHLSHAAHVLQDPQLRAAYDRHGEAGVEQATSTAQAERDMETRWSSSGLSRRRATQRVIVKVTASLEEIFTGAEKAAAFSWEKPCSDCHRTGCKSGKSPKRCRECRGSGMIVHVRQVGPGMIQQSATPCPTCGGSGAYISRSDRCATCNGKRTSRTAENVTVNVPKGAASNLQLLPVADSLTRMFEDEVMFVLEQAHHPQFERRGPHLMYKHKASLVQALTGLNVRLKHVDGSTYQFNTSPPNMIVKPGSLFQITNMGLPKLRNTAERGDLFIQIDIEFPATLTSQIQLILKRCLPDERTPVSATTAAADTTTTTLCMNTIDPAEASRIIQGAASETPPNQHPHHPYHNISFASHPSECRTM